MVFSVLPTRCHTKCPKNLQVLIYGFLVYCLPCVTKKVLPIYRFFYMGFYCIAYQVLQRRSYQSTGSYIQVFTVLSTRRHTKCPTNLQFLIHVLLLYCLPGVIEKVLPVYRFLYTGFQCIVIQVSHKRSYQSTGFDIWVFTVLSTRCNTKGPTNLHVHIQGFLLYCLQGVIQEILPIYRFLKTGLLCIVYQVSHKRSYQSTGSYIWVFTVLSTRCHTKGPSNLQVLIYGFLVYCLPGVTKKGPKNLQVLIYRFLLYCLPGVTQKVLPIYRFLIYGFFVYCLLGVTQKVLPIYRFLYMVFSVLPTRCHTKCPKNLQVLIYGFLVYCLPCVTKKVLPIYRFFYMGFYCIAYQVLQRSSYQSTGSYIWVFSVMSTRCHTNGPTNLQVLIFSFQCITYQVSNKRSYPSTGF